MTNKQKRLIENYIRLKVKKVLNEGHDGNEVLDQSIRTLDQITSMLSNLQRDLYALSKNPDNRDISDKIIKIINLNYLVYLLYINFYNIFFSH